MISNIRLSNKKKKNSNSVLVLYFIIQFQFTLHQDQATYENSESLTILSNKLNPFITLQTSSQYNFSSISTTAIVNKRKVKKKKKKE